VLAEAARLFTVTRRFDEAQAVVDRAVALDPLSPDALLSAAELAVARGDLVGSRAYYLRLLEVAPDSNYAMSSLVQGYLLEGNKQAALAAIRGPADGARTLFAQAMVQHSLGNRAASDRALQELIRRYAAGWAYQVGVTYARRGEADQAFEWFDRAAAQHDGGLLRIQTEPMLAPLWKDPRFPALRKKVGLAE
jgi:tetratricopeptide (TPR) repeat protein